MKNPATPSSIFIFIFSSCTGELCSQPIRANDRRIGRMFPEHVERSFLDPEYTFDEYSQLGSRRKVLPIKNQLASPNTSSQVREETFAQLRTGFSQSLSEREHRMQHAGQGHRSPDNHLQDSGQYQGQTQLGRGRLAFMWSCVHDQWPLT